MANTDTPKGLSPIGTVGQSAYRGEIRRCVVLAADSTDIGIGDLVKLANTGSDSTGKYQSVTLQTAGDAAYGVCVGIEPLPFTVSTSDNLQPLYVVGSDAVNDQYLLIDIDPNTVYEIQEVSGGTALVATSIGLNASIVNAGVTTATGFSGMELDNSTENTTATLELKIMNVIDRPGNALGEHCKFAVKINNHQLGSHTGTAGV